MFRPKPTGLSRAIVIFIYICALSHWSWFRLHRYGFDTTALSYIRLDYHTVHHILQLVEPALRRSRLCIPPCRNARVKNPYFPIHLIAFHFNSSWYTCTRVYLITKFIFSFSLLPATYIPSCFLYRFLLLYGRDPFILRYHTLANFIP